MVIIELGEVERINSCGVRDWVNWLSAIEARGSEVVLVKCSPAIVAQINLVNNFTGNGSVKSFYVPYFCPECDEEKVLLSETDEMGPPPHEPPVCRCDGCDLVMDFDDMPDSYFAFLTSQRKVSRADQVQSVLDNVARGGGESAKIASRPGGASPSGNVSNSSLPSVPSLPSITGTGGTNPGGVGSRPGALPDQDYLGNPQRPQSSDGLDAVQPKPQGAKGGVILYVLAGVLLVALGVLGYLLFLR
jgi:hypothetical protein